MCRHVEILSWLWHLSTSKHFMQYKHWSTKVAKGLCLYFFYDYWYTFRIAHHWKHLPHCPDWLFYCAFTSLCWVTSSRSQALFLETTRAISMLYFPLLLLAVCFSGFVHPGFIQYLNARSQVEIWHWIIV